MAITALNSEDESMESESQACHTLPDDPADDHLLLPHFTPQRLVGGHSFKGLSAWSRGPRQARSALKDVLFLGPPCLAWPAREWESEMGWENRWLVKKTCPSQKRLGCCNKVPQTEWFLQQTVYMYCFLEAGGCDQGVGGVGSL